MKEVPFHTASLINRVGDEIQCGYKRGRELGWKSLHCIDDDEHGIEYYHLEKSCGYNIVL